jgi:hypothetical protein
LGIALVVIVAIMYDAVGRPLSWFSIPHLIFGMYFCPLFFGLAIGPALFLKYRKKVNETTVKDLFIFQLPSDFLITDNFHIKSSRSVVHARSMLDLCYFFNNFNNT